ncbi:hypothetical protein CLOSTASPAR_02177 [[Clostridium] asparagiforme DSM 15981]|uniref:Uncharacterized protein n=1 Tax=[Clostridium] asparagiforme DSM 15981 TaxID=518636 RepID=C0CYV0_9FIRM|nr:hypothetical protein CLOSTASPAR_02177 [[Clostridium] asparagiforme DSM 15981]
MPATGGRGNGGVLALSGSTFVRFFGAKGKALCTKESVFRYINDILLKNTEKAVTIL